MIMYLDFSAFTSSPVCLVATTKASVFLFFSIYTSAQYSNIISIN